MKIDISFKGASFAEYERAFRQIPEILREDAYRRASMRVARNVLRIAKVTAPVDKRESKDPTKRYKNRIYAGQIRKGGRIQIRGAAGVTVRGNKAWRARTGGAVVLAIAPHSHLIEFGTVQRTTRAGANRGRMPAYHTLDRAADTAMGRAPADYAREIRLSVFRIARQLQTGKLSKRTLRAFQTLD